MKRIFLFLICFICFFSSFAFAQTVNPSLACDQFFDQATIESCTSLSGCSYSNDYSDISLGNCSGYTTCNMFTAEQGADFGIDGCEGQWSDSLGGSSVYASVVPSLNNLISNAFSVVGVLVVVGLGIFALIWGIRKFKFSVLSGA